MPMILYVESNYISPYVFACFVALTEKKIAFSMQPLDAAKGETRTAEYLARTVTGRVPSLTHDDFALGESAAIVEYLEDAFPEVPMFPSAIKERARCRQLMSWLRSDDTAAIREERGTDTMFYARAKAPLSAKAQAAADKLIAVAGRILEPGTDHLFSRWSLVDAELAYMLHRLILNGDPVPAELKSWAERQWQRPSVQAWVALPRPKQ